MNNAIKTFHSVLGIEFSHNSADNGYPSEDPVYLKDVQRRTWHNFCGETFHKDWGDTHQSYKATRSRAMDDRDLPERARPDEGVRLCKTKVAQPVKGKNLRDQW